MKMWLNFILFSFDGLLGVRKLISVLVVDNLLLIFILLRLFVVRFDVERREHVGEQGGVDCEQRADGFGEVAVRLELDLGGVAKHDQELDLRGGERPSFNYDCDVNVQRGGKKAKNHEQILTICIMVKYRFHHKYFCIDGMADSM